MRGGELGAADDTIALLERALDQTGSIIASTGPHQAAWPTPCADWDVAALVRHIVGQDLPNFAVAARGETADWAEPAGELGDDWSSAFEQGAQHLLAVWRAADLDRPVPMPGGAEAPLRSRVDHQITELAVHGWDLARATEQSVELDPALAERALGWSRQMLRPEFRGQDKAFGAEVAVPDDAAPYERLAGWFGRDPAWTPPAAHDD
jgi:uncharacterized protein (TIGR03086 family)